MTWIIWRHGTQEMLAHLLKVDICSFGVHMKLWVQKTKEYSHATVRYWFLKFCYDVMESYWRYCTYFVEREMKIKVGCSESYKQALMGWSTHDHLISCLCSQACCSVISLKPVSMVPTIMSMKWKLFYRRLWDWTKLLDYEPCSAMWTFLL